MEDFFAAITMIFVFSTIFGFLAFNRYLRYKETVKLAEHGLLRGAQKEHNGKNMLRWGVMLTAIGSALCVGLYPIGFVIDEGFPLYFGPWMLVGLLPTFFGVGLIVIFYLTEHDKRSQAEEEVKQEQKW
ncbi:MAG: DUF6249 domain-containing protein [Ardenticatenaceae bacterium]